MRLPAGWRGQWGCFNPRPAVRPGDARAERGALQRCAGFNPRPAVRPGDAGDDTDPMW